MVNRLIKLLFCSIFILLLFPIQADARSFSIDAVDIGAYILPNGDVYVEELFTYSFKGKFNGTTRIIGDDDFDGIEFFEAYQVPDDAEMGKISQSAAEPLRIEKEDFTYKVHRSYKDETKKVFYRYKLLQPIRKYEDIGEFYWRFFDEMGEEDLHHVRIGVYLYGENLPSGSYGFLHDLTGGEIQLTQSSLFYRNKLLPGGEPFELRLLFPNDFLSEMNVTKKEKMLPAFLKEEEKYEKRLAAREKWLPIFDKVNGIIFILLVVLALYSIFFPRRMVRFFSKPVAFTEIEEMDSLTLAAIHNKLDFNVQDINSALFRLYQYGYVSVHRVPARQGFLDDIQAPNHTFQFVLEKSTSELREYEIFLIDWLFTRIQDGKKCFSLDQLPMQTKKEIAEGWRDYSNYKQEQKLFGHMFKDWKKMVEKDSELHTYISPVLLWKFLVYVITPIWMVLLAFGLFLSMQSFDEIWLPAILIILGYIYIIGKNGGRFMLTALYLISTVILSIIGFGGYGLEFLAALTFTLIIIAAFLPKTYPTIMGAPYFKGIKRWKKAVNRKELKIPDKDEQIEKLYQHAISLEIASTFQSFYGDKMTSTGTNELYPLLIKPAVTAAIYDYNHRHFYSNYHNSSSGGGSSSGSSGGSGGGGGAGAF